MKSLQSDLANWSFVKCPWYSATIVYEQYTGDLNDLLYKQTPKVSRTFIKVPAKFLSDSYWLAKVSDSS